MKKSILRELSDKEKGVLLLYSDEMVEGKINNDIEYLTAYEGKINGFLDCLYLQNRFDRITRNQIFHYFARERFDHLTTGGK